MNFDLNFDPKNPNLESTPPIIYKRVSLKCDMHLFFLTSGNVSSFLYHIHWWGYGPYIYEIYKFVKIYPQNADGCG